MTPPKKWVWYGYAGHLIVGSRCRYHLATRVGNYFISTVGDYFPERDRRETIGGGPEDFFETMVFPVDGELPSGDPNILDWSAIECARYKESIDAERGHRGLCNKYAARRSRKKRAA
jgi:hypothetical protein